jgi:hypothetical protein
LPFRVHKFRFLIVSEIVVVSWLVFSDLIMILFILRVSRMCGVETGESAGWDFSVDAGDKSSFFGSKSGPTVDCHDRQARSIVTTTITTSRLLLRLEPSWHVVGVVGDLQSTPVVVAR